jgi:putative serine protease PepD
VSQIVAGKTVAHAYLGVKIQDSTSPQGAQIAQVVAGAPAGKAGLKAGDVIVKLGDSTITSGEDLSSVIDAKKPGDSLSVTYVRSGAQHTTTVNLGTRPS